MNWIQKDDFKVHRPGIMIPLNPSKIHHERNETKHLICVMEWFSLKTSKFHVRIMHWILFLFILLVPYSHGAVPISPMKAFDEERHSHFTFFKHEVRVQRSVTPYHHNHHSHQHRKQHRNQDSNESRGPITQCPKPAEQLTARACAVDPCQSDQDCLSNGERCCYNGCLFSCAISVHPPALIDWQTRQTGDAESTDSSNTGVEEYEGNFEFDIVPGEKLAETHRGPGGELCSTTVEDGDILLDCPHGYICHVVDNGNPAKGLPNRGECVKVLENVQDAVLEDFYSY